MAAPHTSLADVRAALANPHDPAYAKKQLHRVPLAPVVKRREFLCDLAKGKTILHLGASGIFHDMLLEAAGAVKGLDRIADPAKGVEACDFDAYAATLPVYDGIDLIIAGEILEHLSNPGWLLDRLKIAYPTTRLIVTAPNAFTSIVPPVLKKGIENVNIEHVAWYSYTTLSTLLTRHGYTPAEFCWYNGQPYFAEGLVMAADPMPPPETA